MLRSISSILLVLALGSASCQKERDSETPAETPKDLPTKAPVANVSIASVALLQDCPDADSDGRAVEEKADEDREAPAMGATEDGFAADMACSQSSMQIAVTGQGGNSAKLSFKAIRLLGPKGQILATIVPRGPTIWKGESYVPWDQTIMPKTEVKASYKLSAPNWAEIEKALGGSSYGPLYRLEADVMIDEATNTIRSPEVVREQLEMIDT